MGAIENPCRWLGDSLGGGRILSLYNPQLALVCQIEARRTYLEFGELCRRSAS